MKKLIPFLMATLALPALGANYTVVPNWAKVPTGETQIGSMHGDVAVSSDAEVIARLKQLDASTRTVRFSFVRPADLPSNLQPKE